MNLNQAPLLSKVMAGFLLVQLAMILAVQGARADAGVFDWWNALPTEPQLSLDGLSMSGATHHPVLLLVDPNPPRVRLRVPPRDYLVQPQTATASFQFTYIPDGQNDLFGERCYAFPPAARAAVERAGVIWGNILQSSVPITVRLCWINISGGILGYSGGGSSFRNFLNAPRSNTWFQSSLANSLAGSDLAPDGFDMHIAMNGNFSWYLGLDANPPSSQYDFVSTMLHEIAHGLNFMGSMREASGQAQWGNGTGFPNIYDVYMRDGSGNQLIDTSVYPNPSFALGSAVTSNNLWFHGTNAMAANSGQRVKMYAPSPWAPGSSYSHLDFNTFRAGSQRLMVYAGSPGDAVHDPGAITIGLLKDLGWRIASAVTYTLTVNSSGASGVAITANQSAYGGTTNYTRTGIPNGTSITLTAPATAGSAPFSNWSGCGSTSGNTCTVAMTQNRTVTVNYGSPLTLGEALDNPTLTGTTGGSANWYPQTEQWYFGGSAAASGTITHNQNSWIQTTVTGPGTLRYHWRVSSESGWDFLSFYLNGALQAGRISGEVDWTLREHSLPAGTHTLRWEYAKDGSVDRGSDRGWLDRVLLETSAATYTLSVSSSGASGVAITANQSAYGGTTNYTRTAIPNGTSITLTAPATSGAASFSSWSGCGSTSGNSCTVAMTQNRTVTANYTTPQWSLTVNSSGASGVAITASQPAYGGTTNYTRTGIPNGTSITLTAPATAGSAIFSNWSGCNETFDISCIVSMSSNKTVTAIYSMAPPPSTSITTAVLPYARAVRVGELATAFATIINSGDRPAMDCLIALPEGIPADLIYRTTDAQNLPIGEQDTPVDIPAGGQQGFVFGIRPLAAMDATEIALIFDCANSAPASSYAGLNTFILTAAAPPLPDLLAIGATPSNDGVVRLPGVDGISFFAAAAVNIGDAGTVEVSADDAGRGLPLTLRVCETDAAGQWLSCDQVLSREVAAGQTLYYTVVVTATGQPIAFDPAVNRLFLRFTGNGTTVGATNVAVTTGP